MSQSEDYKVVSDLRPGLRGINLKVKAGPKNEIREVVSKKTGDTLRVTEVLIGDETGSILLTLWNDDIDKAETDHNYEITNSYTTVFKGSLRLNLGKYGSIEESDEESPTEINEENNLSSKVYEQKQSYRPRYGGDSSYGGGGRSYRSGGGGRGYSDRRPRRRY